MAFYDMTIAGFGAELATRAAVPGGGGASALVGSLGAALGRMVAELTVGKAKYIDVEAEMQQLIAEAEALRLELQACIDADAEAFEPLSKAYGMAKDATGRDEYMEQCLKNAASVPMEIARLSAKMIELHKTALKGSVLALSDVGTGVEFSRAALRGAALNVLINTRSMKDRTYAEKLNSELDELLKKYLPLADEIYEIVYRRYSGR